MYSNEIADDGVNEDSLCFQVEEEHKANECRFIAWQELRQKTGD